MGTSPFYFEVTFIPERTVGDACPYKYIISYVVGGDVLDDPYGHNLTFYKKTIPQSLRASSLYTREPLFKSVSDTGNSLELIIVKKRTTHPPLRGPPSLTREGLSVSIVLQMIY